MHNQPDQSFSSSICIEAMSYQEKMVNILTLQILLPWKNYYHEIISQGKFLFTRIITMKEMMKKECK